MLSRIALASFITLILLQSLATPAFAAQSPQAEQPEDWPTFHNDNNRTGYASGAAPHSNSTAWVRDLGSPIWSSPTIQNNTVYITTLGGELFALDAHTGETRWKIAYDGGATPSSPTISDNTIYFATETGFLYAVDSQTGVSTWPHPFKAPSSIYATPLATRRLILVGSACQATDSICQIYAIEKDSGRLAWSYDVEDWVISSAAGGEDIVITAAAHTIYALITPTGTLAWSYNLHTIGGGTVLSAPLIIGDRVIAATANGMIAAMDRGRGEPIYWTRRLDDSNDTVIWFSSPSYAKGDVFIGANHGSKGRVYSLNSTTGAINWSFQTPGQIGSSPALADGLLFIGSMDNNIYALNMSTGALEWMYETGKAIFSSPAIAYGTVFIGSYDARLYAFSSPNFEVRAQPESVAVVQGQNATFRIEVRSIGGFTGTVYLWMDRLDDNITPAIAPQSVVPPLGGEAAANLTIPTAQWIPGEYGLVLHASSGRLEKTIAMTVYVTPESGTSTIPSAGPWPPTTPITQPVELFGGIEWSLMFTVSAAAGAHRLRLTVKSPKPTKVTPDCFAQPRRQSPQANRACVQPHPCCWIVWPENGHKHPSR